MIPAFLGFLASAFTAATTATTAGTVLATGAKVALAYQGVKTAKTVYKYATTDQEKEGRELGIEIAAKAYAPVLEKLERQKEKIIAEKKNEQSNFESQAKLLTEQCEYYERETANHKSKIETIKREHGDSPVVKSFIVNMATSGVSIGNGATMLGINSARAFSSAVWSAGISWFALPAAVLTAYLEDEMNSKHKRFLKEELEKQSLAWQGKIESCKAELSEHIKSLKFLKHRNTYKVKELKGIVDDALKEYCGAQVDYNTLKMVVKQK